MKGNAGTLSELATEIERRQESKHDYVVPSQSITMDRDGQALSIGDSKTQLGRFDVTDFAHHQIASKLRIPTKFYDRIKDVPVNEGGSLRSDVVNALMASYDNKDKKRLVRTLDGTVRGFLSDSYAPDYDNYFLLGTALPIFHERNDLEVVSASLSESRMYLQVTFKDFEGEVKNGDVVRWGLQLRNSEVGNGVFAIEEFLWRLWCLNGATHQEVVKKRHLGHKLEADVNYERETVQVSMQALQMQLRDTLRSHLNPETWAARLASLRETTGRKIEKPQAFIQEVTKVYGLSEDSGERMLSNMVEEGNLNQWGFANAVTSLARDVTPDRAYQLERLGGEIMEMPGENWFKLQKRIAA